MTLLRQLSATRPHDEVTVPPSRMTSTHPPRRAPVTEWRSTSPCSTGRRGAWSRTPIRDTSCCCHPLTAAPYLRPGPRRHDSGQDVPRAAGDPAGRRPRRCRTHHTLKTCLLIWVDSDFKSGRETLPLLGLLRPFCQRLTPLPVRAAAESLYSAPRGRAESWNGGGAGTENGPRCVISVSRAGWSNRFL